jgi:hypothetical protein
MHALQFVIISTLIGERNFFKFEGQNSSVISHRTGEIWDCGFVIVIEIEAFNDHRRIEQSEDEI